MNSRFARYGARQSPDPFSIGQPKTCDLSRVPGCPKSATERWLEPDSVHRPLFRCGSEPPADGACSASFGASGPGSCRVSANPAERFSSSRDKPRKTRVASTWHDKCIRACEHTVQGRGRDTGYVAGPQPSRFTRKGNKFVRVRSHLKGALLLFGSGVLLLGQQPPLKLDELVSEALRSNPEILAAQKRYEAARQRPT
jgi:hypothetical protein